MPGSAPGSGRQGPGKGRLKEVPRSQNKDIKISLYASNYHSVGIAGAKENCATNGMPWRIMAIAWQPAPLYGRALTCSFCTTGRACARLLGHLKEWNDHEDICCDRCGPRARP